MTFNKSSMSEMKPGREATSQRNSATVLPTAWESFVDQGEPIKNTECLNAGLVDRNEHPGGAGEDNNRDADLSCAGA